MSEYVEEPVASETVENETVASEAVAEEPVESETVVEEPVADEEVTEEPVESVEELEAVIDGPIYGEAGDPVISEVVVEEPVVNESVTEDTTSVPIEKVASDIRGILSTSVEEVNSEPREVTREEWLAAGPRRRKDGTWRKFPEMV